MSHLISRIPVTIPNGTSLSNAVILDGLRPSVIHAPTAWDAACLTFQGSGDGTVWGHLFSHLGVEITCNIAVSFRIPITFTGIEDNMAIKIRSGTAGAPVNQSADRIIYLEFWE